MESKRISLLIREDQYEALNKQGLKVSGLVRDLVDDYLSDHKITLAVSEETRALYDKIVANTGCEDGDIEVYLRHALKSLLHDRIENMKKLAKELT